jgi:hypothetical protein
MRKTIKVILIKSFFLRANPVGYIKILLFLPYIRKYKTY